MASRSKLVGIALALLVVSAGAVYYSLRTEGREKTEVVISEKVELVDDISEAVGEELSMLTVTKPEEITSIDAPVEEEKSVIVSDSAESPDDPLAGRPVFVYDPDEKISLSAQVQDFVRSFVIEAGPYVGESADQLLLSEKPLLRTVGAILLIKVDELTGEAMARIAEDENTAVAFNVLGYLSDLGADPKANELMSLLGDKLTDIEGLKDVISSDSLMGSGRRAVLDVLRTQLTGKDIIPVCQEVLNRKESEYSARMKGLLILEDSINFEQYRGMVNDMADTYESSGISDEADFSVGLRRLTQRLEGPVEIHEAADVLSSDYIDEQFARPYSTMLEDTALHIEEVLYDEEGEVAQGASATLKEYIDSFKKQPWSSEQELSLERLEALYQTCISREAQ